MFLKKDTVIKLTNKTVKHVYAIIKLKASLLQTHIMKRIIFMVVPIIVLMLAFRPVTSLTVTGTIKDEKGQSIPVATVMEKGTRNGTSSLHDGTFKIMVANKNSILVFSSIGFESQEIKLNGKTVVDVVLKSSTASLQEVVVVGHQTVRKKELVGATAQVSTPQYNSVTNALQGRAAGIQITPGIGFAPGTPPPGDIMYEKFNTEDYDNISENRFLKVSDNPLSTFSIDVDAASYSNMRRYLNHGELPPAGAVRIEEMINYFKYEYPQPHNEDPFSINTEISDAPWNKKHKLVLIGLQGKKIPTENLPPSNLTFLIDVSGSMQGENRLPLVKASMKMLVDQLRQQDKVSIVVYAGAAGLVLSPTSGADKTKIKEAIDRLHAGGSTAGGAGLKLAYKTAKEFFVKNGNNRVILCTDGDFNVGESSDDAMERLIEEERKSGVFLTVLGYGMGNYKDNKMQKLADKGNGNHAYIDGITEAKKVLVNEFGGTLFTIAKDVKLQIEFNPSKVQGYRLIGYENRMLAKEDFNDDRKDAGELGSGHTVTALYEVIPVGVKSEFLKKVDPLKYQKDIKPLSKTTYSEEMMTVKFRYKAPNGEVSKLIEHAVNDSHIPILKMSDNFRFAAAVAEFGMLLRNSEFKAEASFDNVIRMARKAKGIDDQGYRSEFIRLVESAHSLATNKENGKEVVIKTDK
jgi:Ca-activated chloride channel family protein